MDKFTPGPWRVFTDDGKTDPYPRIEASNPNLSVVIWGNKDEYCGVRGNTDEEALANARLIAAAPDMLAALHLAAVPVRADVAGS